LSVVDPTALEVRFLKGTGPRRAALLAKMGIRTVGDLLLHLPTGYVDRSAITPLGEIRPETLVTASARVLRVDLRRIRGGRGDVIALLEDDSGRARAVWYNQPYLAKAIRPGSRILASGPVRMWRGLQLSNPEFEILDDDAAEGSGLVAGRIVPIYPLTAGISQKILRGLVDRALALVADAPGPDPLPADLVVRFGFMDRATAVRTVHFPAVVEDAERARRRLAFEEFFFYQLLLLRLRAVRREPGTGKALAGDASAIDRIRATLPFHLTGAQERACEAILQDLASDSAAMRLLQGDVGSGKTVVAALACAWTITAGAQACVMAPTEVLAMQHARSFARILDSAGVRSALLLGRTPVQERRRIAASIESGTCDLVIGTHALLEPDVRFRNLGLVVVDEQHRFGVEQRLRLREKGPRPHTLVLSATPIPRTLALALYGDLDLTTIDEVPPGRAKVRTMLVERGRWDDLLAFVSERLRNGQQAFFVYPLVKESEKIALRDATRAHAEIAAHAAMRGLRVGLLHGRTDAAERDHLMNAMRDGSLHALVATTVIEVGIDLPRATVMVVEHAERFGLSQLHQLRGRIGRAPGEVPYFFMISPEGESSHLARERLAVLVRESNGFRIAEEDLRLRGPGELLGTQQAGVPRLPVGDLAHDGAILREARAEAEAILRRDPTMRDPAADRLWAAVLRRHPEGTRLFGAA